MKRQQAYQYELRPSGEQRRLMRRFAGSCRFVLALQKARYQAGESKLGWLRYRNSRPVPGDLRNVTVSLSGGKWFISIQTGREVEVPLPSGGELGSDLGIARFATFDRPLPEFDHKDHIAPLNRFRRHETRLGRAQRSMSRKVKFSHNWKKAKARVQRIHATIGQVRRDSLHQATHMISQNHAVVFVEDLQVRKGQVRPEQGDPRPGLVRVPPATGLQAGLARWAPRGGATAVHQPDLPLLRACVQ